MTALRRFIFASQQMAGHPDQVHRYALDDPYRDTRPGVMTLREYQSNNRPSLWRVEIQPWLSGARDDWFYQLPGEKTEMVGPFADVGACRAALIIACGHEVLP